MTANNQLELIRKETVMMLFRYFPGVTEKINKKHSQSSRYPKGIPTEHLPITGHKFYRLSQLACVSEQKKVPGSCDYFNEPSACI
jgi:hypothetical protein